MVKVGVRKQYPFLNNFMDKAFENEQNVSFDIFLLAADRVPENPKTRKLDPKSETKPAGYRFWKKKIRFMLPLPKNLPQILRISNS